MVAAGKNTFRCEVAIKSSRSNERKIELNELTNHKGDCLFACMSVSLRVRVCMFARVSDSVNSGQLVRGHYLQQQNEVSRSRRR